MRPYELVDSFDMSPSEAAMLEDAQKEPVDAQGAPADGASEARGAR